MTIATTEANLAIQVDPTVWAENMAGEELSIPVKILIVDDNPVNLSVMGKVLENEDYQITMALSGRESLDLILREDFALIFMDVRMPIMDGFETARIIRERGKSANIPIMFLTSYAQEDMHQIFQGYSLGAVDYLVKPVAPEILRSKAAAFVELYRKNEILRIQKQQLRISRDELEKRVKERTVDLAIVNAELGLANEELQESLKEKDLLLKEIHHRVKNNLQIVSSILSLQSNYIQDPRLLEIFQDSQSRIKSIALIHELLYEKGNLAKIEFKDYLENLVDSIFRTIGADPNRIAYSIESDAALMELDSAIHCGLIVNELLTNAIKYAFPNGRKGKITVRLKVENEVCTLTVEDNGIGLPPDLDIKTSTSMGLQLVDTLIHQIGATLEMRREGGVGYELRFAYPHPK